MNVPKSFQEDNNLVSQSSYEIHLSPKHIRIKCTRQQTRMAYYKDGQFIDRAVTYITSCIFNNTLTAHCKIHDQLKTCNAYRYVWNDLYIYITSEYPEASSNTVTPSKHRMKVRTSLQAWVYDKVGTKIPRQRSLRAKRIASHEYESWAHE